MNIFVVDVNSYLTISIVILSIPGNLHALSQCISIYSSEYSMGKCLL